MLKTKLDAKGASVQLSRNDTNTVTRSARAEAANAFGADIYLSIHHNSSRWPASMWNNGTTAIYPNNHSLDESLDLANSLISNVSNSAGFGSLSPEKDSVGFGVLLNTNMPAVILEVGYMTSNSDMNRIVNKKDDIANGIVAGILDYFTRH